MRLLGDFDAKRMFIGFRGKYKELGLGVEALHQAFLRFDEGCFKAGKEPHIAS